MEQSHYFNQESIDPKYYFRINGFVDKISFPLWSAKGLFSADYFDLGTRILLKYFSFWQGGDVCLLDLGSGYGLVSSFLASQYIKKAFPTVASLSIDACDVSPLAIDLTQYNLKQFLWTDLTIHVQHSHILSDLYFSDKLYDIVITNPPFSAGKKIVKQFISQAYEHLSSQGVVRIVIPTKKGAKSYIDRCREEFGPLSLTIQAVEAGYRVWTIEKHQ